MNAVMPVTISLVMAVVAGAVVWLLWSVVENLGAARLAKRHPPEEVAEDAPKDSAE